MVWGERNGVPVVKHKEGADPGAVAFDALAAAKARGMDVLIVDTAGRLHTKSNLMEELKKVQRILARELPGAPHETLFVLDATTGQNALAQAKTFHQEIGVTGIVLTKLDGTPKGGIVFAINKELGIPVKFIGLGEGIDDLKDFDPQEFVEALL
jgi:fused signal recognition particle receptor